MAALFRNRKHAGELLAKQLSAYATLSNIIVLALPRGGVPVAAKVAEAYSWPLDVFVVRKLGAPGQEELALGAIASGGVRVLNDSVVRQFDIPEKKLAALAEKEGVELERREQAYRSGRPPAEVTGKTVILVDDGLATGASMYAAVKALREREPERIVVAVPIASPEVCRQFEQVADDVVCAETPTPFHAVGAWYDDFSQTSDEEVRELLARVEATSTG